MAGLDYQGMAQLDPVALAEGALYAAEQAAGPICQLLVNMFSNRSTSASNGGGSVSGDRPAEEDSEVMKAIDTEAQRRAYETVNYVLRNFGCRITEAQVIDAVAMNRALCNASEHIEVRLFSPDMNLLFRSLQSRLNDMVLLRSVFASIYLLGALSAELTTSLPNYKESYTSLGPHVVNEFFKAAIGADAYAQDVYEKEKAFRTLAATAGLLRPTDIGYSIFPGFPSFSPSSYSSKKGSDVRTAKGNFEKLKKHFERHGFPQPLPGHDVGGISDWRFLAGDSNNRTVEVEKADKHIGDNFGRVIYWMICSASRMPTDRAIICYHDQHCQLARWLGKRAGFRVLSSTDLDLSPKYHAKLDQKLQITMHGWAIIMPPLIPDVFARPASALRQSFYNYQVPLGQGVMPEKPPLQTHYSASQTFSPQAGKDGSPPTIPELSSTSPTPSSPNVPPAYSPTTPLHSGSAPVSPGIGELPQKQYTIRRKAPAAPNPVTFARALYDFAPEADDSEGLSFKAGEVLEIVDKVSRAEDGWWRGRIRGSSGRVGLVPQSFLIAEEAANFTS